MSRVRAWIGPSKQRVFVAGCRSNWSVFLVQLEQVSSVYWRLGKDALTGARVA